MPGGKSWLRSRLQILIEATENAPGAPEPLVVNQCRDRSDIGRAAREQLERLRRGKPSAA